MHKLNCDSDTKRLQHDGDFSSFEMESGFQKKKKKRTFYSTQHHIAETVDEARCICYDLAGSTRGGPSNLYLSVCSVKPSKRSTSWFCARIFSKSPSVADRTSTAASMALRASSRRLTSQSRFPFRIWRCSSRSSVRHWRSYVRCCHSSSFR